MVFLMSWSKAKSGAQRDQQGRIHSRNGGNCHLRDFRYEGPSMGPFVRFSSLACFLTMPRAALPLMVRGLRVQDAARYVGVSESTFENWVKSGLMPQGFTVDRIRLWDARDVDYAFDMLKGQNEPLISDREPAL
jgi:predicted DNA-binding transcriptional regulator AlpA